MTREPKIVTEDVRALLLASIRPDDPDFGDAVQLIAEKADTSTRTVYRVLGGSYAETMNLGLADRLALAAGGHLVHCRIEKEPGAKWLSYAY